MKRAEFIKSSCLACSSLALPGAVTMLLESCGSMNMVKVDYDAGNKRCLVPLTKFLESNLLLLRVKGFEFDFIVIKKSETFYQTFELRCSHEDQPLDFSNKNIFCASHGSVFNFDGVPLKQPATRPLKPLKTSISDQNLVIQLK